MTTGLRGVLVVGLIALGSAYPAYADGAGELKFDESSFEVLESAGVAVITVERSRGEDGAVSVSYETANGTASAGSDYTSASGTLSWADGDESNRTFNVPIADDGDAEGAETIVLTLSNPTGGAIIAAGEGTSTVVILANDGGSGGGGGGGDDGGGDDGGGGGGGGGGDDSDNGELHVDDNGVFVSEGGTATVVVERSSGDTGTVTVDYATADGTATAGADYPAAAGTLTWGPGDETNKTITFAIADDGDAEGLETFTLTISNPTGGAIIRSGRATGTVNIFASDGGTGGGGGGGGGGGDDDGAGTFKFDQRGFVTVEGVGLAVISVERSHGEAGAVTVDYATADGTAEAGADYTATLGTLSWGPGDGSIRTFTVPIANDGAGEAAETVFLSLSNPTGGGVLDPIRGEATLTITDNDGGAGNGGGGGDDTNPGVLKFGSLDFQVIEGNTVATIRVERSGGGAGATSVVYETADGSATAGDDYTATSGVLSWGNGDETDRTFTIDVADDTVSEGNESVLLTLMNSTGGATIDPVRGSATLQILDNDGATTACVPDANTQCLLGDRFRVVVNWRTRNGNSDHAQAVPMTDTAGLFWFFEQSNVEMLVKMVDACADPRFRKYWFFFAATTNVDFTVQVTDTATGLVKEYQNPLGQAASPVQDTFTFATCP